MMGQFMVEEPLQIQSRNHQEAREVQDGELEEVVPEVQVKALVDALVGVQEQVDQEGEVPAAAVVAAVAAAVEEILQETLQEIPIEAKSVAVMMMMTTPKTIRTKSSRQILQGEGAHDRRKANLVQVEQAKVASSPE